MRCNVVLTERMLMGGGEQPDAIGWTSRAGSLVVECKVSRADFYADRAKPHRRVPDLAMGRFRYYMTPPQLLRCDELPDGFGLIEVPALDARIRVIVKATRQPCNEDRERNLLVSELSRYQIHGISYPAFGAPVPVGAVREETESPVVTTRV